MTELSTNNQASVFEQALIVGNLAQLSAEQRVSYYNRTCESLGLNPLTKPFEYIVLNGKLTLYAKRDATDQLRQIRNVSVRIVSRERVGELLVVTAQASLPNGRVDESVGAVVVGTLKGDALANAIMKAETKAKRRVTLSICGLGMLDETEVASISDASHPPAPDIKPTANLEAPAEESEYSNDVDLPVCPSCDSAEHLMESKYKKPGQEFYCRRCKKPVAAPMAMNQEPMGN